MSKAISLADLLEKHSDDIELRSSDNRIVCKYSGYEMVARADIVSAYLYGAKFRKNRDWYSFDYSTFLPWIVEDKNSDKRLYCKLTKNVLNKIPEKVRQHVNGKKFRRYNKFME